VPRRGIAADESSIGFVGRTEQDARDEQHPPPRVLLVPHRLLLPRVVAQQHLRADPHRHSEETNAQDEIRLAEYPVQRQPREPPLVGAQPGLVLVVGDVGVVHVIAVRVMRAGAPVQRASTAGLAGLPRAVAALEGDGDFLKAAHRRVHRRRARSLLAHRGLAQPQSHVV
jgi:hypothetical protein